MNTKRTRSVIFWTIFTTIFSFVVILQTGCSKSSDPASPPVTPVLEENTASNTYAFHHMLAYGMIYVDPETESIELVPARAAETHLNIRKFVEEAPCTTCLKLVSVMFDPNGDIEVGLQLTHPLPGFDEFTCFDPRCILIFNGSEIWPELDAVVSNSDLGDGELINADGYTRIFNPVEFPPDSMPARFFEYSQGKMAPSADLNATVNGYKNFPLETFRRYLGTTMSSTAELVIRPPEGAFEFGYVIDVCWEQADTTISGDPGEVDVPSDFLVNANMPEAYELSTSITGEIFDDGTGSAELLVDVYDWQLDGKFAQAQVESPDLFDGLLTMNFESDQPEFTRFRADLTNDNLAPIGEYDFLVAVIDEMDGYPLLPAIAYTFGIVEVSENLFEYFDPVALAGADPLSTIVGENIFFFDQGSFDPDGGDLLVYEWDFDSDGIYDEEGTEIDHSYDNPGMYEVQYRVTDDEYATDTLDEPIIIEILDIPPELVATLLDFHSPYCVRVDTLQNACYVDCTQAAPVLDFGFYKIDENENVTKEYEKSGSMFQGMPGMFGLNVEARKLIAPDILGIWPIGGPIDIWDLDGGDPLKFYIPVQEEDEVAFMWDGEFFHDTNMAVIAEGLTDNLFVWDIDEVTPVYSLYPTNGFPQYLEADYDNHRLFLYCMGSGTEQPSVMVFDSNTWDIIDSFDTDLPTPPFMSDLDYDPDFNRIYFGSGADSFEVWECDTYNLVQTVPCGYGEVRGVDHMDGKIYVDALDGIEGRLLVYDAETLDLIWDVPIAADAGVLACNPNNGKIYIASMADQVVLVYQD